MSVTLGKWVEALDNGLKFVVRIMGWISAIIAAIIAVLIVANVIGRLIFENPVLGSVELVGLLLVACANLGIAYTELAGGHVSIDMFVNPLPTSLRRVIDALMNLLTGVFLLLVTWQAWMIGISDITPDLVTSDVLRFPLGPLYLISAIGLGLMGLQNLMHIIRPVPQRSEIEALAGVV